MYTCSCISPCMILPIKLSATWNQSLFLRMHLATTYLAATWYQFLILPIHLAADWYQPLFLQAILSARQYSWFYFAWPRLFLTALSCFCLAYICTHSITEILVTYAHTLESSSRLLGVPKNNNHFYAKYFKTMISLKVVFVIEVQQEEKVKIAIGSMILIHGA